MNVRRPLGCTVVRRVLWVAIVGWGAHSARDSSGGSGSGAQRAAARARGRVQKWIKHYGFIVDDEHVVHFTHLGEVTTGRALTPGTIVEFDPRVVEGKRQAASVTPIEEAPMMTTTAMPGGVQQQQPQPPRCEVSSDPAWNFLEDSAAIPVEVSSKRGFQHPNYRRLLDAELEICDREAMDQEFELFSLADDHPWCKQQSGVGPKP